MYQLVQIRQLSSSKCMQAIWFAHLRDDQGLTEQEIYEWCVRYLIFCLFATEITSMYIPHCGVLRWQYAGWFCLVTLMPLVWWYF